MQATTARLHPLLAIAAISVIVLSGVGVATLAGVIPSSKGQENALQLPAEVVKPIAPAISHPVVEAPRPQPLPGQLAVVESVREVKQPGDAKGVGARPAAAGMKNN